ncbi:MAG: DUF885 domain-containing protein [Actinobacteria bacterium]|nr:MAG: DUF885 domain-containing protein [Actinomycetota bacterium]REK40013.1 MAG: DUF885 domain-containing protein [Actinomycetota bacterium]
MSRAKRKATRDRRRMSLDRIAEEYWRLVCEYAPTIATVRGEHEFDDQLRTFDSSSLDVLASRFRTIAAEAGGLDTTDLSIQEQITVGLVAHEAGVWATEIEDRLMVAPIDPYLGVHTRLLSDTRMNTVQTRDQADALLDRYRKVQDHLREALAFTRDNAAHGLTPTLASLRRVLDQLDRYLRSDLSDDPFLKLQVPGEDSGWHAMAREIVEKTVRPAFAEYRAGLADYIAPTARPDDRVGLKWIPGGDRIYQSLIHRYTQLERTAQEIHDIGQKWGTEILVDQWAEIGQAAFGLDDIERLFAHLHQDPALRFGSADEMLEHARDAVDRAWDAVDDWFNLKPTEKCDVVPVPEAVAPAMPPAYYMQPPTDFSRPGTYFLNTHKPEERDRFEYESIHFHEAIPGHHFDRTIASRLDVPTFRKFSQVYAHTEGWGLYSERLADEMGLYSSDVDRLGAISADAWRAGRLVVDTGMHALGWSRQQAIDWLAKWTPIGRLTIEQEVDRYIGMPGQALSYKMGQLEILDLRHRAKERLGDEFDIKAFHDVMLGYGAMTLPMLRRRVEEDLLT